jgi:hypothetical protein
MSDDKRRIKVLEAQVAFLFDVVRGVAGRTSDSGSAWWLPKSLDEIKWETDEEEEEEDA